MKPTLLVDRKYFFELGGSLFAGLRGDERLTLNLVEETTQFIRINGAKVRQIGCVENAHLAFDYRLKKGDALVKCGYSVTLTGERTTDSETLKAAFNQLRTQATELPIDPFSTEIENFGQSENVFCGELLPFSDAAERLPSLMNSLPITGIYSAGTSVRANMNSLGQKHWFETDHFSFDYSLFTPENRMAKGYYSGSKWDDGVFRSNLESTHSQFSQLTKPVQSIEPGKYRTYLSPMAVAELLHMFSWGFLSEGALRREESSLRLVRQGKKSLSPLVTLKENFKRGLVPSFNHLGELAPEEIKLFERGELENTLVSRRTAKEYGVTSNAASGSEAPRSLEMEGGSLKEADVLSSLGTGLYLSNLHYLNWSDQKAGRITGMTRYACFWVKDSKIVGPIENLRFDDSVFGIFGTELEALTSEAVLIPATGTYSNRDLGGVINPGALLSTKNFTL